MIITTIIQWHFKRQRGKIDCMRPPICIICDTDFRDSFAEGDYVQFKLTDDDIKHNKRMEASQLTGHPAGVEWFCKDHIDQARRNKNLTLNEALKIMKSL